MAETKKANETQAKITKFDLQIGTERSVFAAWTWGNDHTDHYSVKWEYATGNGVWFVGDTSDVKVKQSVYSAPENATKVRFKVKPVSKKDKVVNKKKTYHWTAKWSTEKTYNFKENPPKIPPVPTVEIKNLQLTALVENLDINATHVEFYIAEDNDTKYKSVTAAIDTKACSIKIPVNPGHEYKVRCRGVRFNIDINFSLTSDGKKLEVDDTKETGKWSEYSANVGTQPVASKGFKSIKALSSTSVSLDWYNVKTATSYEVQYTTQKRYFDSAPDEVKSVTVEAVVGHAEITGLETGDEWFFRVRAVNDKGNSAWTDIESIVIGKKPAAPTTWSSSTTLRIGEKLTLYWVHNTEDGSDEEMAEIELTINGQVMSIFQDKKPKKDDEKETATTSFYTEDTSMYGADTKIKWRVRTKGIMPDFSPWSVSRTVTIYEPPTLSLRLSGSSVSGDTVMGFPFYLDAAYGPASQKLVSCHLAITAAQTYETVDRLGNDTVVVKGSEVYSQYIDSSDSSAQQRFTLTAGNIDLENNVKYKATCTVSLNSGLTAEDSINFKVGWVEEEYSPQIVIAPNYDDFSAVIIPFCMDASGNYVSGVTLSVYRREFDGRFVEIGSGIPNTGYVSVVDPHPALDYARYRVVATSGATGAVSFYDPPAIPFGVTAVVMQWDERWSNFNITDEEDELADPPWTGSMLVLPFNIDVSTNHNPDVSLAEYIGREHPVSYYGTQRGETATWNVEIDRNDEETLYGIRRLAVWMGDVYVREPSGIGYWAQVKVSYNQTHCELTIPVTFSITRVEGGI